MTLGAYFDEETGLYYLQSRYYNPEWHRFLNADAFATTGQGFTGNNMFVYCLNNPIMGCDPSGYWPWEWDEEEEQAAIGITIFAMGAALIFAAPTGGASLGLGSLALGSSTLFATGGAMALTGTFITGSAFTKKTINFAKKSRKSDKERATDKPSWVSRQDIDPNKSAQQNAKDLMDNKYGVDWPKGTREFSQIVKWINRGLRDLIIAVVFETIGEQQ